MPTTMHALPRRWRLRRPGARVSTLLGVPPFNRYGPRALIPLAPHVDRLTVRAGAVLATEDRTVREVLVVVSGEVQAMRKGRCLRRFGPGELIGAAELLCGARHMATLVAVGAVEVVVVNGPAYRWAARSLPAVVPAAATGVVTTASPADLTDPTDPTVPTGPPTAAGPVAA